MDTGTALRIIHTINFTKLLVFTNSLVQNIDSFKIRTPVLLLKKYCFLWEIFVSAVVANYKLRAKVDFLKSPTCFRCFSTTCYGLSRCSSFSAKLAA